MTGEGIVVIGVKRFVGEIRVSETTVSMPAGRLRHTDVTGTRYYPAKARTWPLRRVAEIIWTEVDEHVGTSRLAAVA